jgi:DNA-binding NtrC family response regulator
MTTPRILFVDDNKDILDSGVAALQEAGYDVLPAINSDIACVLLEQGLLFDVLVTDIVLPGRLDGFALAAKAREFIPDIRIIYSTGFGSVARIRARGALYGELLAKPWRVGDLVKIIGQHESRFGSCHETARRVSSGRYRR